MAYPVSQLPGTMIVQDPWEEAFAAYKQALVDLNGDGRPDTVVSMPDNRERQMIARRAMSGREGPLTPQELTALDRRRAISKENDDAVERGVGEFVLGQPIRAVKAIGTAWDDPSLRNVGNAAWQSVLATTPFMPARFALPLIGTDIGVRLSENQAHAQGTGVEDRLRRMPPAELMAYQRMIGANPDGRLGPDTIAKALQYEAGAGDRIRAQGAADAERERIRIGAESEARIKERAAQSDLSAQEAQRPFLQRYPEYSSIAPWVAGGLAAAIPAAGALLSRRGATATLRQNARAIDDSVGAFKSSPTPLNALAVSKAVDQPAPAEAARTWGNLLADFGSAGVSTGVGAALPSAAVVTPYVLDYMQAPDTAAHKTAAQQFTVPKVIERMTGPFALGMALAGGGRFMGEKAGAAFINPAPRGANLAYGQAVSDVVKGARGDPVEMTEAFGNLLRGGQTMALEGKRLLGAQNARPPIISINDMEIGSAGFGPQRVPPAPPVQIGRAHV